MHNLDKFLFKIKDSRINGILSFHDQYKDLIYQAQGSSNNHQAWKGGYADHIAEILEIAEIMYESLNKHRKLEFSLDSAKIVLYFHDVEKIWKYTTGEVIDKENFYLKDIKKFKISFTEDELNALKHIHGENEHYTPKHRTIKPLGAFCHCVDTISARIWFDQPSVLK